MPDNAFDRLTPKEIDPLYFLAFIGTINTNNNACLSSFGSFDIFSHLFNSKNKHYSKRYTAHIVLIE